MSKKYIFLKFLEPAPYDFLLDQDSLFHSSSCQTIDNILQLNQEQELRFVIAKDLQLQSALTASLPQESGHGMLWSGTNWPSDKSFQMFDDRLHSLFVFYKTGERPPELLTRAVEAIARKWELYNWHIYQIPGLQLLKNNIFVIRALSNHELEADKQIAALWRAYKDGRAFPWQMSSVIINGKNKKNGLQPYRPLKGLQQSSLAHFSSLFKFILPNLKGKVFLAVPWNYDYFWPLVSLPVRIKLWPDSILQQTYLQVLQTMFLLSAEEVSLKITRFVTDLRRLVLSESAVQKDLFYSDLEGGFEEYWQAEKLRHKEHREDLSDFSDYRALAAAKYLLNSKNFTQDNALRAFFKLALAQTVDTILKKKDKPEFIQILHQTLREFYLDFYVSRQLSPFIKEEKTQKEFQSAEDALLDGAFAEFDSTLGDKKNRQTRAVEMLLTGEITDPYTFIPQEVQSRLNQALADSRTAELLGQYCVSILVNHMSNKEDTKAALKLRQWLEVFYFLRQTAPLMRGKGRIAVALAGAGKTDATNEWRRVIESFLQNGLKNERIKYLDIFLNDENRSKTFLFFEKE